MKNHYHLNYAGSEGVVFGHLAVGGKLGAVSITIDAKSHVILKARSLPGFINDFRSGAWRGGLRKLFPGTVMDPVSGDYLIPVTSFLAPFWNHPASETGVDEILHYVGQTRKNPEFMRVAKRFPSGPAIDMYVKGWITSRDKAWHARRSLKESKGEQPKYGIPMLCRDLLDLVMLAHWDEVSGANRREILMDGLMSAVGDYAPAEAGFWASSFEGNDPTKRNCKFIKYLKNRRVHGFKLGRPTQKESKDLGGENPPQIK